MTFPMTRVALAIMLLATGAGALAAPADSTAGGAEGAATATSPTAVTSAKSIQRVEVKGDTQGYDPRRDDTATKIVLSHEEIIKYGDTNVFEVLKRAPGVTVIGNSIKMRGLGNGYTQILVNGERPPPGFSMDTLPPEQIDRIEVIRAATAEHSMQAVAGTVNIVLKKVVSKPQRDLRINTARSDENRNLFMIGTLADRTGNLSYYLNAMLGYNDSSTPSTWTERFIAPNGEVTQWREGRALVNTSRSKMAGMQPRLNWKLPDDGQLNVSGFLQGSRIVNRSDNLNDNRAGFFGTPDYIDRTFDLDNRAQFTGGEVNWVTKLAGGKLDAKLSGSRGRVHSDTYALSSTADQVFRLQRDRGSVTRFTNVSSTGKYARTLFDGHAIATGWEVASNESDDHAMRLEGQVGTPPQRIPEHFNPLVVKLAAYAQDEWNVTKDWSMYLGARWEGIRTDSAGLDLVTTQSRTHVLSPVAQTLYKFPDKSGRQLRMALTRTFKAPQTGQLSVRRQQADVNTRFNPDSSGNPDLRPELATGIDLTYEHFWAPGAVFSVGASQRSIRDYMRSRLTQDSNGYWLVRPVNDGNAMVRTLDVEVKFPLKALDKDALPFDFRASVNRNWSKVESVPGPDNRLDEQIPLSAVLGVDYREDKFSAGASLAYRAGGPVRLSAEQSRRLQGRRELEAYGLYKFSPGMQLRLAVSNALGEDNRGESRYTDRNGTSENRSWSAGSARLQANLEMKF
jgi:outer membrane receptor for ferrienterochelin and colicins